MAALHPIEAFAVPSDAVFQSGCRLEGSFYGSNGYRAARALFRSGFDLENVGEHANVFNPPIFKRVYVDDEQSGVPYLTGSALLEARPIKETFLSRTLTSCLDELSIREGMVLISDSGSIGRTVLATRDIDGWASTNNLIRVLSNDRRSFSQEFFYTYFVTSVGEYLLTRNTYGSVVEHIEPAHVRQTPFPVLPKLLREKLTEMIREVSRLRVEANRLLTTAEAEVQRQCGLPELLPEENRFKAFVRSSDQVLESISNYGSLRLDATAFDQTATRIRSAIAQGVHDQLQSLCEEIIYIGKVYRVPVEDKAFGAPLLSGKDLVMVRPAAEKYLSVLNAKHIERCRLQRGWVLVSCSGNIGRVAMCYRNFEGFVGSEHMLRVICDEHRIDSFYLSAFLSSPFGQIQMRAASYGSVIPEFSKDQLGHLLVALPVDRGQHIGGLVKAAYDRRADAVGIEDEAIGLFEKAIEEGKEATESKWGREY
jgi:type I restriction enzyme S subunit